MALVYFQKKIPIDLVELPEPGGYVIAYDQNGKLKQKDSEGNISEIGRGLTITDYITGLEYTNVKNLTFKGASVTTQYGETNGVSLDGNSDNLVVWIPSPNYVENFNPVMFSDYLQRYISKPSNNIYTTNIEKGSFNVGDWNVDIDLGTQSRNVINKSGTIIAFEDNEFSCLNEFTSLDFNIYDGFGTVISSITNFTISNNAFGDNGMISITVNSFGADNDRYKASITGSINLDLLLPNGGRFYWEAIHNNGAEGQYTFRSVDLFKESPTPQNDNNSTGVISGGLTFAESTQQLKYHSGIAYYNVNSSFNIEVSGINNINEITIPTDLQIDLVPQNMAIASTYDGFGTDMGNWTTDWDSSGLTYSVVVNTDDTDTYIPGFTNSNTIDNTPNSRFISNIYDYSIADTVQSNGLLMLFDTSTQPNDDNLTNSLKNEDKRLSSSDIFTNGNALFDSTIPLPEDELQFIFGRVIYPNQNFTQAYPTVNIGNPSLDYTFSNPSNRNFNIYTDTSSGVTTNIFLQGYRWFTTSYEKENSFTNGVFILNSNFTENDLHYNGINTTTGTEDLVIMVGIDSSGNNSRPDSFLFVSGNPNSYPARQNSITYNFDKSEASKDIQFSKGTVSAVVKKVWLVIGYKDSIRGRELRLSNISLQ